MPTVLLLRQLDAPLATEFVGFVFPRRDDPLLRKKKSSGGGRVECGGGIPYLKKVVISLLGQGRGW